MKKTIVKSVLGAGFALAAGVVFATPDVSQTFDEQDAGAVAIEDTKQKWSGDGTVVQEARVANIPTMGSAISADASTKYLAVAGSVSCTNKVASTQSAYQADFLVNIAEACDELTTDGLTGAQIAVAAGTTVDDQGRVAICVYCGSTPSWVTTDALVATGSWARVSLYFDYSASPAKCRVTVNGQPAKYNDSEYYDLIASSMHFIKQLDFVGVAKIDDVFIASGTETEAVVINGSPKSVNVATLAKYGVSTNDLATGAAGTGGLTPWNRYEAGLALNDAAADFEPVSMVLPSVTQATITVPFADNNGQSYSVVISDENEGTATISAGDITSGDVSGGKSLTFTIPTKPVNNESWGKVLKFTVNVSL